MKFAFAIVILVISISCFGCSSSRVVLLAGDKTESAIVVKTEAGELVLDEPNTYTDLSSAKAKPSAVKKFAQREIQNQYGQLLRSAPKPPIQILLYFQPDSTNLTEASEQLFPAIEKAIRERFPCDVNIIGHADRAGAKDYNTALSLRRARHVHRWLLSRNLEIEDIAIESYGEEDPLVPTKDEVPEPRNRRVEVLIR